MPIDPKRVEAAARAIAANDCGDDNEWPTFADPPTAWVAPWTPTEAMLDASAKEEAWRPSGHWEAHDAYPVMRDAHTKEQGGT